MFLRSSFVNDSLETWQALLTNLAPGGADNPGGAGGEAQPPSDKCLFTKVSRVRLQCGLVIEFQDSELF